MLKFDLALPVAMMLSPGASTQPGGLIKQLFGAVVWNWKKERGKMSKLELCGLILRSWTAESFYILQLQTWSTV
jgi:hypothetical protein